MGRWADLKGTLLTKFQIGLGGPQVKNNSGVLEGRNAADSAYAAIAALLFKTYGNDFELNSGAASSGADWKLTLSRPSSGMTHALQVIWPSADPSNGQVLYVVSFAANVITLGYTSAASTAACQTIDTTSLAFGTSSPIAMFTAPANAVHELYRIYVDTAFDGAPTMSVGISGTASKYVSTNQVDLTTVGVYEVCPAVTSTGSTENIIATYSAGAATVGAARIEAFYAVPA